MKILILMIFSLVAHAEYISDNGKSPCDEFAAGQFLVVTSKLDPVLYEVHGAQNGELMALKTATPLKGVGELHGMCIKKIGTVKGAQLENGFTKDLTVYQECHENCSPHPAYVCLMTEGFCVP